MNQDQGFVDLRLNRQEGQTDEGFWPSFTDIMTVIVMIFLLAMVILLMRNMELVEQLRSTMQAEREAAELARATGEEKASLAGQLGLARRELTSLRGRIARMEEMQEQQEAAISSQRHQIAGLNVERDRLQAQSERRLARSQVLEQDLAANRATLTALQTEHQRLLERQADTRRDLENARRAREMTAAELDRTRLSLSSADGDVQRLRARLDQEQSKLQDLRVQFDAQTETLTKTQTRLARISDERDNARSAQDRASTSLTRLQQDYAALTTRLDEAGTALEILRRRNAKLDSVEADYQSLRTAHNELQQRETLSREAAQQLKIKLQIQEQALAQAMARLQEADLTLSALQDDYGDLKLKYDDLVKPARTAEGRYVVEVRYEKIDGEARIRFREHREGDFIPMTPERLDTVLNNLRDTHKEGLYIKVIIPEDSGLSYNEAWRFTTEVHSKYDYYYKSE